MKCMERNKVDFHYALYVEKKPITDDYGNVTGEYEVIYGNPTTGGIKWVTQIVLW